MTNYSELFQKFTQETQYNSILLIDGLNLFIRCFQANPTTNDNGDHIGGILGIYRTFKKLIYDYKPTQIYVIMDGKGGSLRRRKILKEYKGNRISIGSFNRFPELRGVVNEEQALENQVFLFTQFLDAIPVRSISIDNIEADDCIAYLTTDVLDKGSRKIIVSSDKDFLQLITNNVSVYSPDKKILVDDSHMYNLYGYTPLNYLTLRCFTGDRSDNIKGVNQVGPKSLNTKFNLSSKEEHITLEHIFEKSYEEVSKGSKAKIYHNIVEGKGIALRNYELMQLQSVDISGIYKSRLRDFPNTEVDALNVAELQRLYTENRIFEPLQDALNWGAMFRGLR